MSKSFKLTPVALKSRALHHKKTDILFCIWDFKRRFYVIRRHLAR